MGSVLLKKRLEAQCWWPTPVILAVQEAEIRMIMVPSQPKQKVCKTPTQPKKIGLLGCTCHSSYSRRHTWRTVVQVCINARP
jgi:hypothetical protein